jgi:EmrB/QacA subfamily drug resistance transporter
MKPFKLSSLSGKLVLLATIIASGMGFLDGSVVNIAVPAIQKSLGANLSDIQWIINSYMLFLATLILISGALGDRFGVKRIFSLGIIVFTVSSFLCGISNGILQLIIFRAIQGIGAAMMVPGSLSIITTSFESREHGKVIGLWSGVSGGIAALGPLLGGYLVQVFGWPSIFFINIPLGIIALLITLKYIPLTKFNKSYKMDFLGAVFIFLAFLGITYGLIQQPISGFSDKLVSFSLFSGICLLGFFIIWEKFSKNPLIPFSIFKNPLATGSNLRFTFVVESIPKLCSLADAVPIPNPIPKLPVVKFKPINVVYEKGAPIVAPTLPLNLKLSK